MVELKQLKSYFIVFCNHSSNRNVVLLELKPETEPEGSLNNSKSAYSPGEAQAAGPLVFVMDQLYPGELRVAFHVEYHVY